ncbi:hypothetical protein [uncultured Bacteroides sp.]|uniref:hypothetical protein n=1 Tax=uncultured Bacteroides sp. TaxID=162156 RepID=UPI0025970BF9|nr:hypothetical protein [uncultured Bacteroides sp.]
MTLAKVRLGRAEVNLSGVKVRFMGTVGTVGTVGTASLLSHTRMYISNVRERMCVKQKRRCTHCTNCTTA